MNNLINHPTYILNKNVLTNFKKKCTDSMYKILNYTLYKFVEILGMKILEIFKPCQALIYIYIFFYIYMYICCTLYLIFHYFSVNINGFLRVSHQGTWKQKPY